MARKFLSESEIETPMDYSTQTPLSQPDEQHDLVDEAIWGVMDEVIAFGHSESAAEKRVRDAIDKLVKDEVVSETPEYDEPDGVKSAWISNSLPRVKNYLRMKGDIL